MVFYTFAKQKKKKKKKNKIGIIVAQATPRQGPQTAVVAAAAAAVATWLDVTPRDNENDMVLFGSTEDDEIREIHRNHVGLG